jgi:hypothetical protein
VTRPWLWHRSASSFRSVHCNSLGRRFSVLALQRGADGRSGGAFVQIGRQGDAGGLEDAADLPRPDAEWADLLRDLDRLQEATIEKDGKRITTRTAVAGQASSAPIRARRKAGSSVRTRLCRIGWSRNCGWRALPLWRKAMPCSQLRRKSGRAVIGGSAPKNEPARGRRAGVAVGVISER